jgi:hypothetical protein
MDAYSGNFDMNSQTCLSLEQEKEIEPLLIKAQREKERKYSEWADLVLAGKTNLSLSDWMTKNYSKR